MSLDSVDLCVLLTAEDLRAELEADARTGLTAASKWLPPKYFYDDRGSDLFEQITSLPEYYPTSAERGLLRQHADEIAQAADAQVLLELGSGSSEKTRLLLDAMAQEDGLHTYIATDVSSGALRGALDSLHAEYPDLDLVGVVGDLDRHLGRLPAPDVRLVALLGGTIGNYAPQRRRAFLAALAEALAPGESFLLGVDLVKPESRLVAAYDDAAGVTAAFNLNVLTVLNRELDADFPTADFEHVAVWDAENEWIEMRLRARRDLTVRVGALDLTVEFDRGEELRTEISAKFHRDGVEAELASAGLEVDGWWTDGDFALVLSRRR